MDYQATLAQLRKEVNQITIDGPSGDYFKRALLNIINLLIMKEIENGTRKVD